MAARGRGGGGGGGNNPASPELIAKAFEWATVEGELGRDRSALQQFIDNYTGAADPKKTLEKEFDLSKVPAGTDFPTRQAAIDALRDTHYTAEFPTKFDAKLQEARQRISDYERDFRSAATAAPTPPPPPAGGLPPAPTGLNLSLEQLNTMLGKLNEQKTQLDGLETAFRDTVKKDFEKWYADKLDELRGKLEKRNNAPELGKALEDMLSADLDALVQKNDRFSTKALRAWNRATGARAIAGAGLSVGMALLPGSSAVLGILAAKGALSAGSMASAGDSFAMRGIEQHGANTVRGIMGDNIENRTRDDLKTELESQFTSLTSDNDRREYLEKLLRAYGEMTYISSIKGLQIDSALLDQQRAAGTLNTPGRSKWIQLLDRVSQSRAFNGGNRLTKTLVGLGVGAAGVTLTLTGPVGIAAAGLLQAGYIFMSGRARKENGELYERSAAVEAIQDFVKGLATSPEGRKLLEYEEGKEKEGAESVLGRVKDAREKAKKIRGWSAAGGAVLGASAFLGSAALRGLGDASPQEGAPTSPPEVTAADTGPVEPGDAETMVPAPPVTDTPAGGVETPPTPETPKVTLNLKADAEAINQWREAQGLPEDVNAVLYQEGPGADKRLAEVVLDGFLKRPENAGVQLTPEQHDEVVGMLQDRWKEEGLFSLEDGSLIPEKRDVLIYDAQGGIDSLADTKDAVELVTGSTDVAPDLPPSETPSSESPISETPDAAAGVETIPPQPTTEEGADLTTEAGSEAMERASEGKEATERVTEQLLEGVGGTDTLSEEELTVYRTILDEPAVRLLNQVPFPEISLDQNEQINQNILQYLEQVTAESQGNQEMVLTRLELLREGISAGEIDRGFWNFRLSMADIELMKANFADLEEHRSYYLDKIGRLYFHLSEQPVDRAA